MASDLKTKLAEIKALCEAATEKGSGSLEWKTRDVKARTILPQLIKCVEVAIEQRDELIRHNWEDQLDDTEREEKWIVQAIKEENEKIEEILGGTE